jgi:branched-subunit amino acid transport protein
MSSGTSLWVTVVAMGAVTYGLRLTMIALVTRRELPAPLAAGLRYVPPAVLSALILPELLRPTGPIDLSPANVRLIAGLLAAVVAWKTRSALLTIGLGMALLWAARAMVR